ncbi:hypothetical protein SESBI_14338 [Sesbania bispinosa]|nr:hypothetical protein SESBI_14338 [Sesbania bispinosa]
MEQEKVAPKNFGVDLKSQEREKKLLRKKQEKRRRQMNDLLLRSLIMILRKYFDENNDVGGSWANDENNDVGDNWANDERLSATGFLANDECENSDVGINFNLQLVCKDEIASLGGGSPEQVWVCKAGTTMEYKRGAE